MDPPPGFDFIDPAISLTHDLALDNLAAAPCYILHPNKIPPIRAFKLWVVGRRSSQGKRQKL